VVSEPVTDSTKSKALVMVGRKSRAGTKPEAVTISDASAEDLVETHQEQGSYY
jgi:hypothetical protein